MTQSITEYFSIDIVDNLSDHLPVQLRVFIGNNNAITTTRGLKSHTKCVKRPFWHKATSHHIEKYKNLADHFFRINCITSICKNSEHTQGIDSLYESFIYASVKATQLS